MLMWHFFRWLEEAGERREYKGLPRGCWHCEVLGLCRRPKEEGWKCYNGCMLLNYTKKNTKDFQKDVGGVNI